MALQATSNVTQADGAGQLSVDKRHKLALGRQPPHMLVGLMAIHKPVEGRPGNALQKIVEDAILVPHGVVSCSCPRSSPNARTRVESIPCAVSTKLNRT